ncbi:MAG: hypothetical protein MUD08_12945, partial [Cytophagales bacterium]|nr:hypothetical protein [Cytophagales bacterium]
MPENSLTTDQLHNWLKLLESGDPANVQLAVAMAEGLELPPETSVLVAVVCQKWRHPNTRRYYDAHLFQANDLGWTATDENASEILQILTEFLYQREQTHLIQAAGIFRLACPEPVYIGNGDAGGYEADCQRLWTDYQPFA